MIRRFFPAWSYFKYWLRKEDQYSIQSPFVFELYNGLIAYLRENRGNFDDIVQIRKSLLNDHSKLEIEDYGAGSIHLPGKSRKVSDVARFSTSSPKYCMLYQFFCKQTPALSVFELGTCLGINVRYLSKVTKGRVFSFEGSSSLLARAKAPSAPANVAYVLGPIEQTLPPILDGLTQIDFALIDATHTFEATMAYYHLLVNKSSKNSIIAVADIHWSKEMETAWREIISDPRVGTSIDFYECGIVFFDTKLPKAHYILDY